MRNRAFGLLLVCGLVLQSAFSVQAAAGETFYLGINLGAPSTCSLSIDSKVFRSHLNTTGFSMTGTASVTSSCSKNMTVLPTPSDTMIQKLLNSALGTSLDTFKIQQTVANGTYNVYFWAAEMYASYGRNTTLILEGVNKGSLGRLIQNYWHKFGPYQATVSDGVLDMEFIRITGNTSFRGIEIYSVTSPTNIYNIGASTSDGGLINPRGTIPVAQGDSVVFTIIPKTGYIISDVSVGGVSQGAITSYTFRNVQANDSIKVTCLSHKITALARHGGTISPSGTVNVVPGGSQTFTITADANHEISQVFVNGVSQGAISTYTFSNVQARGSIVASFKALNGAETFYKGINFAPSGCAVTIDGNSYVSHLLTSGCTVPAQSTITGSCTTAVVSPDVGADFNKMLNTRIGRTGSWGVTQTVDNGNYNVYLWICEKTLSNSRTFTIKVEGTVKDTVDSIADETWKEYGPYQATITDGVLNMDFDSIKGWPTLSALGIYSVTPLLTITASAGTGGTISPSGIVNVAPGGNRSFTITPNTGYVISNVVVNGVSQGLLPTYSFINLQADATISVTFVPISTTTIDRATRKASSPYIDFCSGIISFYSDKERAIEIVDGGGRTILQKRIGSQETYTVPQGKLTQGVYFLRLKDAKNIIINKKVMIVGN